MPTSSYLLSLDPFLPYHTPCDIPLHCRYSTGITEGYKFSLESPSEAQELAEDFKELAELEEEEGGV